MLKLATKDEVGEGGQQFFSEFTKGEQSLVAAPFLKSEADRSYLRVMTPT